MISRSLAALPLAAVLACGQSSTAPGPDGAPPDAPAEDARGARDSAVHGSSRDAPPADGTGPADAPGDAPLPSDAGADGPAPSCCKRSPTDDSQCTSRGEPSSAYVCFCPGCTAACFAPACVINMGTELVCCP